MRRVPSTRAVPAPAAAAAAAAAAQARVSVEDRTHRAARTSFRATTWASAGGASGARGSGGVPRAEVGAVWSKKLPAAGGGDPGAGTIDASGAGTDKVSGGTASAGAGKGGTGGGAKSLDPPASSLKSSSLSLSQSHFPKFIPPRSPLPSHPLPHEQVFRLESVRVDAWGRVFNGTTLFHSNACPAPSHLPSPANPSNNHHLIRDDWVVSLRTVGGSAALDLLTVKRTFNRARVFVAPHAPLLNHMVFMPPRAVVLELRPQGAQGSEYAVFHRLADACGLDYHLLLCQGEVPWRMGLGNMSRMEAEKNGERGGARGGMRRTMALLKGMAATAEKSEGEEAGKGSASREAAEGIGAQPLKGAWENIIAALEVEEV
ncbi:unnamed protein product [Closterium sp. Naga37s-1]|nr:unnamed protein product [Closterium sp. Naga37s-1]